MDICPYLSKCYTDCDGFDTETCECFRLHEHIEKLVDAINLGTKTFSYEQAPYLHEAMKEHLDFEIGA